MQNISQDIMRNLVVPLPPLEEQAGILEGLDRETGKIDALVAEIRLAIDRLKELRTALISAAVTGKIDVREEGA
jgi:restriction endonuclease S subunit